MKINIAIDGPSASGKSTVAKQLCSILNYVHLDTGAMYRCVALEVKRKNIDIEDVESIVEMLNSTKIQLTTDGKVYLNDEDVTDIIRTNEISLLASDVSTIKEVREHLVALQQKMAQDKGFIMDGRDIGTVVLPDAELKIYLTASVEARAKRRYLENKESSWYEPSSNIVGIPLDAVSGKQADNSKKTIIYYYKKRYFFIFLFFYLES